MDFDGFYDQRPCAEAKSADTLVLSCDAKGVVMRPGALRPKTARAAAGATAKLTTRLSPGEKKKLAGRERRVAVILEPAHPTRISALLMAG